MAKRKQSKWRPKSMETLCEYNSRTLQQLCTEKCRNWSRTLYALDHEADCSLCGATKINRQKLGAHKYLHGAHAGVPFRDMLDAALKHHVLNNDLIQTQVKSVCSTFQKIHGLTLFTKECSIIKNTCSTCNPFVEKLSPLKVEEYLAKGPIFWWDHMRAAAKDDATIRLFDRPNVKFKKSPICHWYTPVLGTKYNGIHEFYWSSHRAVHEPPSNLSSNRSLPVVAPVVFDVGIKKATEPLKKKMKVKAVQTLKNTKNAAVQTLVSKRLSKISRCECGVQSFVQCVLLGIQLEQLLNMGGVLENDILMVSKMHMFQAYEKFCGDSCFKLSTVSMFWKKLKRLIKYEECRPKQNRSIKIANFSSLKFLTED